MILIPQSDATHPLHLGGGAGDFEVAHRRCTIEQMNPKECLSYSRKSFEYCVRLSLID